MKVIKTLIILVFTYVGIRLLWLVGCMIFGFAGNMVPSDKPGHEQLGDAFKDCGEYFHEKSGRSDAEREKSMNASGLYWNPETESYEEDPERFSRDLDAKFGKIGE